jgi:hypothetical protein
MGNLGENLIQYLKDRNNRFKNSKGMEIGLTASDQLWTYLSLSNHNHGPLAICISTEDDAVNEFIDLYNLALTQDINNLDYSNAWMRYLNGYAQIDVTPYEVEATLSFRIYKRKTIIYSLDLHYYDEAYEHLTLPEDFDRYIATHYCPTKIIQKSGSREPLNG